MSKNLPCTTFASNNLVYPNQISLSATLQELLFFTYKSPLRYLSPADIYFTALVSVNASPLQRLTPHK